MYLEKLEGLFCNVILLVIVVMNDGDDSSSDLTINNAAPDTLTRKPSLKTEQGSFHQKTSVPQLNDDTKFLSHNLCW